MESELKIDSSQDLQVVYIHLIYFRGYSEQTMLNRSGYSL